jgi:hypothetical protein
MWIGPTSKEARVPSNSLRRWRVVCLTIGVLLPSVGGAQSPVTTTVMKSALHSFFDGHVAYLTVSEIGAARASSLVTIQFLDDADRLVARATGDLSRGQPVRLEMPVRAAHARLSQIRAVVTLVAATDAGSVPMAVLEDVDAASLTVGRVVGGTPQPAAFDPRGVAQDCPPPGWHVTVLSNAG